MSGLTSYCGLTTKIRAMKGGLLKESDFQAITELATVQDAVNYLRQFPAYKPCLVSEDDGHATRVPVELHLRQSLYRDFSKIYRFANGKQRAFLDAYFKRFELYFIKICARSAVGHLSMELNLAAFGDLFEKHSKIDFPALGRATSLEEFKAVLANSDYKEVVQVFENMNSQDLFDLEMLLDIHHFRDIWKNKESFLSKKEVVSLEKILGTRFDILNIQWIHRSKKYYNLQPADIYAMIIPINYHLSKAALRAMIEAENSASLEALISTCYYGKRYKEFTSDTLEPMYSAIVKGIMKQETGKNPYSFSSVYSYLYNKEHEVERLTIALECVRYRVPADRAAILLQGR